MKVSRDAPKCCILLVQSFSIHRSILEIPDMHDESYDP